MSSLSSGSLLEVKQLFFALRPQICTPHFELFHYSTSLWWLSHCYKRILLQLILQIVVTLTNIIIQWIVLNRSESILIFVSFWFVIVLSVNYSFQIFVCKNWSPLRSSCEFYFLTSTTILLVMLESRNVIFTLCTHRLRVVLDWSLTFLGEFIIVSIEIILTIIFSIFLRFSHFDDSS